MGSTIGFDTMVSSYIIWPRLRRPSLTRSRFVSFLAGLFLLIAAGLKVEGTSFDLSQDLLGMPQFQLAVIEVEVILGLWLVSGWWNRAARAGALAFFAAAAAASLYMALIGAPSCGCFGRASVSPWITLVLDLTIFAALALLRPPAGDRAKGWARHLALVGVGTAFMLAAAGTALLITSENPAHFLARLRGETIAIDPWVSDVGEGTTSEDRCFTVRLTNHADKAIRIVGGSSSCRCVTTEGLPVTLPPGRSVSVPIRVSFRGKSPGRFQLPFTLFTDDQRQPVLTARFAGRVLPAPAARIAEAGEQ